MKSKGGQIPFIGLLRVGEKIHIGLQMKTGADVGLRLLNHRWEEIKTIKVDEDLYFCGYYMIEVDKKTRNGHLFQIIVDGEAIVFEQAREVCCRYRPKFGEKLTPADIAYGWEADSVPDGWENDRPVDVGRRPAHLYKLHLRGFTGRTAGREGGTFRALRKKIDYLRSLSVSHILCFPIYEFTEWLEQKQAADPFANQYAVRPQLTRSPDAGEIDDQETKRVQYWGYTTGFYYAVKAAYAAGQDAALELRKLVMELHRGGIGLIPEFYFPEAMSYAQALAILRYWISAFHLDGVRVLGSVTAAALAHDPFIGRYICIVDEWNDSQVTGDRLYRIGESAQYLIKRAVKGDSGCMRELSKLFVPDKQRLQAVSFHNGFTLADSWMYQSKHNEANGERGHDGRSDEPCWNVGVEGESRSRSIRALRLRLAKNTLVLQYLGGASPLLLSGDEYLHSHQGNNNPYCLDTELNYQKWRLNKTEQTFFDFQRQLILLCLSEPLLQGGGRLHGKTVRLLNYPTLSFHGREPWKQEIAEESRFLAVMFCREYDGPRGALEIDAFYLMMNFHWLQQVFYLPKLPTNCDWEPILDTAKAASFGPWAELSRPTTETTLAGRSIQLFRCCRRL
ncbi:MAG: hypothetical protein PUH12_03805 [Lachnospiraceae bacterium]|nr:hypothetical protein [Lachnospiraceae bacterium]